MTWKSVKTNMLLPSENWGALKNHELRLKLLERMADSEDAQRRFWNKADVGEPNVCWEWNRSRFKKGYGRVRVSYNENGQKTFPSHRVAFYLANNFLPENMLVCHTCDNPPCINPKHLFLGTNDDNMADMVSKGRSLKGSRHLSHILVEKEVEEIRHRCLVMGETRISLAKKFKVSYGSVIDAVLGRTWKNVPMPQGLVYTER